MKNFIDLLQKEESLHHAYLLVGDPGAWREKLAAVWADRIANNPDINFSEFSFFGVDESRRLRDVQSRRPFGERKYLVVEMGVISSEAQNALLKTLEEPTNHTHIFLLSRDLGKFLPTILSRCQIVFDEESSKVDPATADLCEKYKKASLSERMKVNENLLARHEEGDKEGIIVFLSGLAAELAKSARTEESKLKAAEKVARAAEFSAARGSSYRLLLDYVALIVP